MYSIPENTYDEKSSIASVRNFFSRYGLGPILKAYIRKRKGIPVSTVVMYLVSLIYTGRSMFQDMRSASPLAKGFHRDAVYRLLDAASANWRAFLLAVSQRVIADKDRLTSESRRSAFVVDDTLFNVPYARKTELVSKVYDHAEKGKNKYKWGFRLLTLGWTDGCSFVPVAYRHLASADEKNRRCGREAAHDRRSIAHRIRNEAVSKATDVMLTLIKAALKSGITAKHVLFDTWFAYPSTMIKVAALGLNVTARVKDTTKIKYLVGGERKTAKEIFKGNKKRRGRSRYLLSVDVSLYGSESDGTLPAKLVYIRNRQKRNEWIALISTDTGLGEEEIIALYGKRWSIEVFFKVCKSYLKLAREFRQLSYDALTAHTAIVMLRYMILSVEKRRTEDPRSLGEMFYLCCDEADDIKFEEALSMLINLLSDILRDESVGLSEEQMRLIMDGFIGNLPAFIQRCLRPDLRP